MVKFSNKASRAALLLGVSLCLSPHASFAQMPDSAALNAPTANTAVPDEILRQLNEGDVPPDVFFDAESLVPDSELAKKSAKTLNPRLEPASRLVVVSKGAKPSSQEAGLVSANRALKLGRYAAALELFNQLYLRNGKDTQIILGRAISLQKLGRVDEAIQAYEAVLELNPKHKEARINMLGLISEKYPAVAMRRLMDLYNEDPQNVGTLAQLAVTNARLQNYQEAIKFLSIASSIEPENANHLYNMGVIADQAKQRKQAIDFYEKALEADTIYGGGRSIPREAVFSRLAKLR